MKCTKDDVTIKKKDKIISLIWKSKCVNRTHILMCLHTMCVNMHRNPVAEEDKPVRHSLRRVGEWAGSGCSHRDAQLPPPLCGMETMAGIPVRLRVEIIAHLSHLRYPSEVTMWCNHPAFHIDCRGLLWTFTCCLRLSGTSRVAPPQTCSTCRVKAFPLSRWEEEKQTNKQTVRQVKACQ